MALFCNCMYGPGDPRCCVNRNRVTVGYPMADWTYRDGYNIPAVASVPYITTFTSTATTWSDPPNPHEGREC